MTSDDLTQNLDDHALLLQLVSMFKEFDARQREFDTRLQAFDTRLQAFDTRLQEVEARLDRLEQKVDERLYDTRPMWESVQSQIIDLRRYQETEFRKLNSKFDKLSQIVFEVYSDQKETERRVSLIESKLR